MKYVQFPEKGQQDNNENGFLMEFFLWWILPALIFFWIYRSAARSIGGRGKNAGGGPLGNFMQCAWAGVHEHIE